MSDDLIKRLREGNVKMNALAKAVGMSVDEDGGTLIEAADALERLQRESVFNAGNALGFKHRAEKAEAELARLTPTEEEKWEARDCINFLSAGDPK